MLKKTIKFTDFDGNEREETFYFNLTKAEAMEMQLSHNGGISSMLKRIIEEKDQKKIMEFFKEFVHKTYGVKSDDGRTFVKNQKVLDEFISTEAYSNLFVELATNESVAADFINGVLPIDKETKANHPALNK